MKKILFSMLIGLMFLAPNAYASENEKDAPSKNDINPYSLINSKGEVIEYSEVKPWWYFSTDFFHTNVNLFAFASIFVPSIKIAS